MARIREVGSLWIGGALSWMEQLCLKSFVDRGQRITLFSYEPLPNVPEGVICRDGREIIDTDNFIKYEKKDSYALFADLFRLHMIRKCPGMIWVDTDVYCWRPLDYDSDYVMGYELPGEYRVNNAVLGLPADSDMLRQMLDFTEDRFSIAPFLPERLRADYSDAHDAGRPVHVSQQPWGVWGPLMVTHFVHALGLADKVQPIDAFYPVDFRERTLFLKDAARAEARITPRTTALHLWASNKRQLGKRHDGLPPKGSFLARLVDKQGINPAESPIKSRGKTTFDGGLIDEIGLDEVTSIADLSGGARAFVLAAHHKYDCDIYLVSINGKGRFEDRAEWIDPYVDFLVENEVDPQSIHIVRREKDLHPVDILANLDGFGASHNVRHLKPFLEHCLHSGSRLYMDVRKGSGAFPLLRDYGTNRVISEQRTDGVTTTRIELTPLPPKAEDAAAAWVDIARDLAGPEGFFRPGDDGHSFLYMPRSRDVLVVSFDNLDIAMNNREDRRPWGFSFIEKQGWSMLGVMANGWTWYRDPWVWAQFDALRDSGFFGQFGRVVFYGASMGGYAACAFCPAAPGSDVVAISPQSTLDKTVVPWETRYKVAWERDFTGPYGDAAQVSGVARRVSILYDPYEPLDAAHVARFSHDNVQRLRTPLLGHRLGSSLHQMGILSPIVLQALGGTLDTGQFYRLLRARKDFPRYQRELFDRAVARGHTQLARQLADHVLARGENRAIRKRLKAMG
ncbi:hypothetical protein EV663_1144 [Rhodovulum bhavnagarense]|uniref:Uncharacterized protein n=1 Tax=Rhodovulum bhavnagarense TaxID=992286 RepID=A0A4R2RCQ4_9RHOB|nr:hypothetical protein [Rhodovulum bhavnagarense]TCP59909.1 hypothetical protein EV663_1144 [Rhodovulum bhavnagarense]